MTENRPPSSRGFLEPFERLSEVLFGLVMVLTFTGSLSAVEADRAEVRTMLIGALGCNFAWGIIDGLLHLMGCLSEQGKGLRALRALREAAAPEQAHRAIAGALPPLVAGVLSPAEYESVGKRLLQLPEPPLRPRLGKDELAGALGVFLWVFTATFPVAIPFLLVDDVGLALRLSNAVAIVLLFITGYAYGRVAEYHPWLTGLAMVVIGSLLVGLTIALGG